MSKLYTIASAFAVSVIMATGITYAIEGANPDASEVFTILESTPAEGAELPSLNRGDIISIKPSCFDQYPDLYIQYEVEGAEIGSDNWENVKSYSIMTRDNNNGIYTAKLYTQIDLYDTHEYRIKFTAWEKEEDSRGPQGDANKIGVAYVTLKGTTKPYENSPYTLVSITPEPNDDSATTGSSFSVENNFITLVYDGPVNLGGTEQTAILGGQGQPNIAFEAVTPIDGEEINGVTYAKEWHLVISESMIQNYESYITVTIKATDAEGRVVLGNMGDKDYSYTVHNFNMPAMYATLTYDFGGDPVAEVESVIVGQEIGIAYSYMVSIGNAEVRRDGKRVAKVIDVQKVFDAGDEDNQDATSHFARLVLDTPLTEAGTYTLFIPHGYFNIGTQFDVLYQDEQNIEFTITGNPVAYEATPAAGKVDEITSFAITYKDFEKIEINNEAGRIQLIGNRMTEEGWPLTMFMVVNDIQIDGNTLNLARKATITEPGNYTLYIPGGVITADGKPLPNITVNYTIEAKEQGDYPATFDPAPGAVEALPAKIDFVFEAYESWSEGTGKATIQFNNETPVEMGSPEFDWDAPANEGWINLPAEFAGRTDEGKYTVVFPKGYFNMGDNGEASPEMILVYTIGEVGPDYPAVFTPASGEVEALPNKIEYTFPGVSMMGYGSGHATISVDGGDAVALPDGTYDDNDAENEGFQPLGDFAGKTEEGVYTITFPEGYFDLDGTASPEMIVTYTIKGAEIPELPKIEFSPAAGSTLEALPERIEYTFTECNALYYNESGIRATISFDGGDAVDLPEGSYDDNDDLNEGYQPLGDFAGKTDNGTYTITFPAGYFIMNISETNPEIVITYNVTNSVGVDGVTVKADRYVVYDTNGVLVLDTTDEAAFKALKGLYIVNGIKLVLK